MYNLGTGELCVALCAHACGFMRVLFLNLLFERKFRWTKSVFLCMYLCVCMYVSVCMHVCMYMYVLTHACMYRYVYVCMYVCMYVCVHVMP